MHIFVISKDHPNPCQPYHISAHLTLYLACTPFYRALLLLGAASINNLLSGAFSVPQPTNRSSNDDVASPKPENVGLDNCLGVSHRCGCKQRRLGYSTQGAKSSVSLSQHRVLVQMPYTRRTTIADKPFICCCFDSYHSLIRTSVVLALTCMYLMWFIIYMAQLHPIVSKHLALSPLRLSHRQITEC